MRQVCLNVVPAYLLVCPCRLAAMRLRVQQLIRIYQGASQSGQWSADVLVIYRRICQLLRHEGLHINHKRVYRFYHLSGLGVKRRVPIISLLSAQIQVTSTGKCKGVVNGLYRTDGRRLVPGMLPKKKWKLDDFGRLSFVRTPNKTPIYQGVIFIYDF